MHCSYIALCCDVLWCNAMRLLWCTEMQYNATWSLGTLILAGGHLGLLTILISKRSFLKISISKRNFLKISILIYKISKIRYSIISVSIRESQKNIDKILIGEQSALLVSVRLKSLHLDHWSFCTLILDPWSRNLILRSHFSESGIEAKNFFFDVMMMVMMMMMMMMMVMMMMVMMMMMVDNQTDISMTVLTVLWLF